MKTDVDPVYRTYSPFAQEFIMNAADGMIIAFAVATGLLAAELASPIVFTTTLLILFAVSAIFGLAAFSAAKIEIRHFYTEMQPAYQQMEDEKEMRLLKNIGLDTPFQKLAQEEIDKDRLLWKQLVEDFELHQLTPGTGEPLKRGFRVGLSLLAGGTLPVLPYLLADGQLTISIVIMAVLLPVMGYLKHTLVGGTGVGAVLSSLLTGAFAGLGAYLVAGIFV